MNSDPDFGLFSINTYFYYTNSIESDIPVPFQFCKGESPYMARMISNYTEFPLERQAARERSIFTFSVIIRTYLLCVVIEFILYMLLIK